MVPGIQFHPSSLWSGNRCHVAARNCLEIGIRKILEHLRLWEEPAPRAPPPLPAEVDIEYLPFLDG
jgi:hypothetical protein